MALITIVAQIQASDGASTTPTVINVGTPSATDVIVLHRRTSGSGVPIASITQTNMAWSRTGIITDASVAIVEEWKGTPTGGTPGTTISVSVPGIATLIGRYDITTLSGLPTSDGGEIVAQRKTATGTSVAPTSGLQTYNSGYNVITFAMGSGGIVSGGPYNGYSAIPSNTSYYSAYFNNPNSSGTTQTNWDTGFADWRIISSMYQGDAYSPGSGNFAKSVVMDPRSLRVKFPKRKFNRTQTFGRAPLVAVTTPTANNGVDDIWFFRNRRRYR